MEDMTLCSPEHREVFQRVWARVMAGQEGACPVEVTGDLPCDCLEQLAQLSQPAELPQTLPSTPSEMDRRSSDLPEAGLEPLRCDEVSLRMRQQVLEALEGWQVYRHLARRTRGTAARTLTNIAADQHKQARRLSAAYFLLTGLRYWPTETLSTPAIPSLWGTLRQRHQAEQQAELSYRMSADETDDPTLVELYQQLMDSSRNRCRQLRTLLEQSCP